MDVVRVISLLLDYPTDELVAAKEDLKALVKPAPLSETTRGEMLQFIEKRCSGDLMEWQQDYDSLFERGRALSLLLFEHVHGESRDRGQAMVDLMAEYRAAGLDIGVRELPDYIPLYLEFLSTQGNENLQIGLADVAHILAVLCARLERRDSNYAVLFKGLIELSTAEIDMAAVHEQIKSEKRDDSKEAMDKVWEEEMVTFGPDSSGDGCSSGVSKPTPEQSRQDHVPINWANASDASKPTATRGV
ncbi:nitrate reductase molybdenum cofactor assembly chaperone [Aliidiomarina celeris]|uniref:nitrate reductase molybdenum cofactor assembly chaperone n=1 Tax=Aliidiomarina celeris TaxID=2249428 RepID=UPI000DEBC9D3|nr:nitrate reductase molybdenum cofactor assembly chaperone [Aliidiomarina celeris]